MGELRAGPADGQVLGLVGVDRHVPGRHRRAGQRRRWSGRSLTHTPGWYSSVWCPVATNRLAVWVAEPPPDMLATQLRHR